MSIEGSDEEKMIDFYQDLQETVDSIMQSTELIIIIGNLNARIGDQVNKSMGCRECYGEWIRNRNGLRMLNICQSNNLLIRNTFWKKIEYKKADEI